MFRIDASDSAALAELRATLGKHGYSGDAIFAKTREWLRSYKAGTAREAAYEYLFASELPVRDLMKLFLSRQTVERGVVEPLLTQRLASSLVDIGLLEQQPNGYRCPYLLFPVEHAYIVTDPIGDIFSNGESHAVFEMVGEQNVLANALLRDPGAMGLDLCTGSGVFAILLSRFCDRVWAVDVNPRAVTFAKFNVLLNGADNVTVLESDLYGSLSGLSFDVITANPPYNPSCGRVEAARLSVHAGFGGEDVLFAILAGFGQHLRPGGRAQIMSRFYLESCSPYQYRLNGVIDLDCFDAVFLHRAPKKIFTLSRLEKTSWSVGNDGQGLAALCEYYKSRGIERETFGILNLRRVGAGGQFRSVECGEWVHDRSLVEMIRPHLLSRDPMLAHDQVAVEENL